MAVVSKEELLNAIQTKYEGDTSDETLAFIEDVTDTLTDFETRLADSTDWKAKYEENDAEWRNKYKERFFNGGTDYQQEDPEEFDEEETVEIKTFDDLFVVEEDK